MFANCASVFGIDDVRVVYVDTVFVVVVVISFTLEMDVDGVEVVVVVAVGIVVPVVVVVIKSFFVVVTPSDRVDIIDSLVVSVTDVVG